MVDLIGKIVRVTAGRGKGGYFLVLGEDEEGRLLLADGKSRKVELPKKKKVKHTEMVDFKGEIPWHSGDGMLTNRAVRSIIKEVRVFFEQEKE